LTNLPALPDTAAIVKRSPGAGVHAEPPSNNAVLVVAAVLNLSVMNCAPGLLKTPTPLLGPSYPEEPAVGLVTPLTFSAKKSPIALFETT